MAIRNFIDAGLLLALRNWLAMDEVLTKLARDLEAVGACCAFPAEGVAICETSVRLDAFEQHMIECVWCNAAWLLHRRILHAMSAWNPSSPNNAFPEIWEP